MKKFIFERKRKMKNLPVFFYRGQQYLLWQDDDYSRVGFSAVPDIENKIINIDIMTKNEVEKAKAKPLIVINNVKVCLIGKEIRKTYTFSIPAGYDYDGASIPRFAWRIIGSPEDIEFKVAALVHDVLCENHSYVDNNRYFADKIFEKLLEVSGAGAFKRFLMFHAVDNYQKFCGWNEN